MSSGLQFEVKLKSMKLAPYVGPTGQFARAVEFRVRSLDSQRTRTVDGGLVGLETLRRCELLKNLGAEVVTVSEPWMNQQRDNWLLDLVGIALQQVADRCAN